MKWIKLYEDFDGIPKVFYTTSKLMNIEKFIEIEVEERKNYDSAEVATWVKKYRITPNSKLLWVATAPWIAARYVMSAEDWDNCKEIYESNPEDYNVQEISTDSGTIIDESDDGDDGYLIILK